MTNGTNPCAALEQQLWEITMRIAVWQLQSDIEQLRNRIGNAHGFAAAFAKQNVATRAVVISNPTTTQQQIQELARTQASVTKTLSNARDYARDLEKKRVELSQTLDAAPTVTAIDYGNTTPGALNQERERILDELMKCYSDNDHHFNGCPHHPDAQAGTFVNCWCGVNHGGHNFFGLQTCWCGEYNDYAGYWTASD